MPAMPTAPHALTVLEHTSDGVLILSRAGVVEHANPQAERLFRRKAETMVGVPFWTLAEEARTAEATETLERALARGLSGRFEIFFPLLYAWHAVTVVASKDGAVLFIRDVTDRMRLLRDEAVRRGIYDVIATAPIAISVTRGPEHRFEIVNQCARELLDGRDVEGMTLQNAFPELMEQGFGALLDGVYTTGSPYQAKEMPVRFRRGAGDEYTFGLFDVAYHPLRDMNGQINGILCISVEVTEHVETRRLIEEMAREREAILAQLAEGVISADREGRIRFVNEAARALHGRATLDVGPEEYADRYELLREDGTPITTDELPLTRAVRQRETVTGARWRIRRPDGTVVLVEGSATPVSLDNGESAGAVLTMHEVAPDGLTAPRPSARRREA